MGTFGMSISGNKGSYGAKHLSPSTTTIGIDPFPRKGVSHIVLTFDHRVLDGAPITRTLQQLQHMLTTAIKVELAEMIGVDPETGEDLKDDDFPASIHKISDYRADTNQKRANQNRNKAA